MKKKVIVQLVDSLSLGGIERMSVNIANSFTLYNIESYLIVTRVGGGLQSFISKGVNVEIFNKSNFFDIFTFFKIFKYLNKIKPDILHAHQTSIFWAVLLKFFLPKVKLIWHDHFGQSEMINIYPRNEMNWVLPSIDAIITVNEKICNYWKNRFSSRTASIFYLPNFSEFKEISRNPSKKYFSIINVANFRRQKDQLTLLDALSIFKQKGYSFKASLIGEFVEENWLELIKKRITDLNLEDEVHIVGPVSQILPFLETAHIGVLSSESEGLPVALLEYGMAGLPTVVTQVGQCEKVLDYGKFGWVVPPKSPIKLSSALEEIFLDIDNAEKIGLAFQNHIIFNYGHSKFMSGYKEILKKLEKTSTPKLTKVD